MGSELELQVSGEAPGPYRVSVVHAAAGGTPSDDLRLDVDQVLARRREIETTVLASAASARRVVSDLEEPVRQVGQQLFEALFHGRVGTAYHESLGAAQLQRQQLRISLRLEAPELARLPWETLYDPGRHLYLCRREPLVRSMTNDGSEPLTVKPPLRVLAVVSSPRSLPPLDVEAEKQHLADALTGQGESGNVDLTWLPEASWACLHDHLLGGVWHVLHYVGHGGFDEQADEGLIALVDENRGLHRVLASELADLLGDARPQPRLVVLNSCSSAAGGVHDVFSSTGAALVQGGINAVVAMQFAVSDGAAVRFARGFYRALANGRRVDEAVQSGRIDILGVSHTLEWVTPVLYVRSDATQLFDVVDAPAADQADETAGVYQRARQAEEAADWGRAIEGYGEVLAARPGYRDAAERRDRCRLRLRVADLQAEARYQAKAAEWQAVLRLCDTLRKLDEAAVDTALENTARQELAKAEFRAYEERRAQAERDRAESVRRAEADRERREQEQREIREAAERQRRAKAEREQREQAERERTAQAERERREPTTEAGRTYRSAARPEAGRPLLPLWLDISPPVPGQRVTALAWQPDGLGIAVGHADKVIRAYTFSAGAAVPTGQFGKDQPVAAAFFADGNRVAVAARPNLIQLWDAARGELLFASELPGPVHAVAVGGADQRVAVAVANQIVVHSSTLVQTIAVSHHGTVRALAFGPDGHRLAGVTDDGVAYLWDAHTGRGLFAFRHERPVRSVAFSPDGSRIATCGDDGARVWEAAGGRFLVAVGAGRKMSSVSFSPDGPWLATTGDDRAVRVWDLRNGQLWSAVQHPAKVAAVAFRPGAPEFATAGQDGVVRVRPVGEQTSEPAESRRNDRGVIVAFGLALAGLILAASYAGVLSIASLVVLFFRKRIRPDAVRTPLARATLVLDCAGVLILAGIIIWALIKAART